MKFLSIFIQENAFENIVCEIAASLSRLQCVKVLRINRLPQTLKCCPPFFSTWSIGDHKHTTGLLWINCCDSWLARSILIPGLTERGIVAQENIFPLFSMIINKFLVADAFYTKHRTSNHKHIVMNPVAILLKYVTSSSLPWVLRLTS